MREGEVWTSRQRESHPRPQSLPNLNLALSLIFSRRRPPGGGYVEETAPTTKERKTSNVVLTILGAFLLAFIVAMIVTFWVKGSVPDTLIQYTMGAGGIEALLLAGIKISKVVAGNKSGSDPPDGVG